MTLKRATIKNLSTSQEIPVMYNPTEYTASSQMTTATVGTSVQFQRLAQPELTITLFFDSFEAQTDVRSMTGAIADLQKPLYGTGAKREPPLCLFSWGGFQYRGLITKLDQTFTLFLPDGTPARAELVVTFTQVMTTTEALQSQGLDNCRKLHVVKQFERLDVIAATELGDPSLWKVIADLNEIDDPINFPTRRDIGRTLVIPDIH